MGVYRRPDSPTWWMSLQVNGQRVRINTMVEDRRLAEDLFCAWKTRWRESVGSVPPPPTGSIPLRNSSRNISSW